MDDSIIALLLSSSLAVAVVTAIKELVLWYFNRRASKEDKKDELTEKVQELSEKDIEQSVDLKDILDQLVELKNVIDSNDKVTRKSLRLLFGDRINYLALKYIRAGEINFNEKQALTLMWECYHYELGGNGTYNDLMDQVSKLKIVA